MASEQSTATLLGLPWIPGVVELAQHLGLSVKLVQRLIDHPEWQYKRVLIPKRNRGYRELYCPTKILKAVQSWILRNILERVQVDPAATAYKRKLGLIDNLRPHQHNHFFVCIDLVGFFDSISSHRVQSIFEALGYPAAPAKMLTSLCTVGGKLPQGGVTSPYLSNIACMRLDRRIRKYVANKHVTYTRYADDITLSAKDQQTLFASVNLVRRIIAEEGLKVNDEKSRALFPHDRRRITGLVLASDHRIGVGRDQRRLLRACIHHLESGSLKKKEVSELRQKVTGWMAFLKSVDKIGAAKLQAYWEQLQMSSPRRLAAPAVQPSPKSKRKRKSPR